MDAKAGLVLVWLVLCTSAGGVRGECRHVPNNDMIEYSCVGGQLSDLNDLPSSTGKIRISNMPIPRITVDTFSRFGTELWVLGCSHCNIMDIEPDAFQRLSNLQQLSLDNNRLSTVKESWFRGLDYLTYLDLNYNNIQSIEDGVFKSLPSLIDLRLSGNRLECLDLPAISHLKDLKRIFLTENSEFKCPNAVSNFFDSRGVNFEKDPEWRNVPADLVPVEMPIDYDTEDEDNTAEEPTTPLPAYRERLHTTTPPPMVQSTAGHVPPRFYTTEEVVYRPAYNTPDWRTTPRPTTVPYEEPVPRTTTPPYENTIGIYFPPRTIAPLDLTTYPTRGTVQPAGQDETTQRTWPRFPESVNARPDFPPSSIQDKQYPEEPDYPSQTDSFPLAPIPDYQEPSYEESEVEHSVGYFEVDWRDTTTDPSSNEFSPVAGDRTPDHPTTPVDPPNRGIQPVPHFYPKMVQPASPENVYQAPYYEHTVTVHSPPMVANRPQQEEVTPGIVPIETTTDKPLPDCPTRGFASTSRSSVAIILVSVVLAIAGRVLVEGF